MGQLVLFALLASLIAGVYSQGLPGAAERDPDVYCQQCWTRRNQKDYYANEFNCTTYYHCFKNGSKIEGILRPCANGLRFDENILACVPMVFPGTDRACEDPCADATTMMQGFWQKEGECGIFYQCSNYYSRKMCCPPNHRFNASWADCMFDKTCNGHNEECGKTGMTIPMLAPEIIDSETCFDVQYQVTRKTHTNPARYWVVMPFSEDDTPEMIKNVEMTCPIGTNFDLNTCKCSIHVNATLGPSFEDCMLDLAVDSEGKIHDASYMKLFVDNFGKPKVGVANNPGSGSDDVISCPGNGHLEVPGLQGMSLGNRLTIMFWVRFACGDDSDAGIMSNRGERVVSSALPLPSVIVRKLGAGAVQATIRTVKDTVTIAADVTCGQWNHVAIVYDGDDVLIYVGGVLQDTVEVPNRDAQIFWMVHCPLTVCQDQVVGWFNGLLNNVRFCREAFSAPQIQASIG